MDFFFFHFIVQITTDYLSCSIKTFFQTFELLKIKCAQHSFSSIYDLQGLSLRSAVSWRVLFFSGHWFCGFVLATNSTPAWDRAVLGHQSQSQTNGPFDYQMCLAVCVIIQSVLPGQLSQVKCTSETSFYLSENDYF